MDQIVSALPVILSLVVLEGLLSVDNAMILAAMVQHLSDKEQKAALRWGLIGAYLLRIVALLAASILIANPWIRILGALYLVYLMVKNLGRNEEGEGSTAAKVVKASFWATVVQLQFIDLGFSIDNVIAAVALSKELWVVATGVFIGMLAMRFVAGKFIGLMKKYPVLESTAYLLVGYVGCQLLFEEFYHFHLTEVMKFGAIVFIILLSMAYDRIKILQTIFGPVVRWIGEGFGNISELIDWALVPLMALIRLFKRLLPSRKSSPKA
jgi:tellurite resistance protein TerC